MGGHLPAVADGRPISGLVCLWRRRVCTVCTVCIYRSASGQCQRRAGIFAAAAAAAAAAAVVFANSPSTIFISIFCFFLFFLGSELY